MQVHVMPLDYLQDVAQGHALFPGEPVSVIQSVEVLVIAVLMFLDSLVVVSSVILVAMVPLNVIKDRYQ